MRPDVDVHFFFSGFRKERFFFPKGGKNTFFVSKMQFVVESDFFQRSPKFEN